MYVYLFLYIYIYIYIYIYAHTHTHTLNFFPIVSLQAFAAIEALSDGGVKMGLPRALSTKLAAQTLLVSDKEDF